MVCRSCQFFFRYISSSLSAAVVAGIRRGLLDSPVRVDTRGGELVIAWAGSGQPVFMTGPAVTVFAGEIELPADLPEEQP